MVSQFMLPDPNDPPSASSQCSIYESIPHLVGSKLVRPELPPCRRESRMFRAAVPETAVHKHRDPHLRKNEIRPPKNGLIAPPTGNVVSVHQSHECEFGILVATCSNARHHPRPLCLAEDVSHRSSHSKEAGHKPRRLVNENHVLPYTH